jgi:uroporphyrinogen III methyltransferase / synthase
MMNKLTGIVYLVGAGPGHPDHLTLKAAEVLRQAEVLVYDALIDTQIMTFLDLTCQTIEVGKRGGQVSVSQADINALLIELCHQGKRVVRLKSGDPFIFGRCGSEIAALRAAGCLFEVIPGLSSALAAPCLAGIPLTDADQSRCFGVLSAHDLDALDWQTLSRLDTLVILMGGRSLAGIVARLQDQGRSPQTPIAIIQWCSQPQQQMWLGTLANIVEQTHGCSLSPSVIVMGDVISLQQPSPWINHQDSIVYSRHSTPSFTVPVMTSSLPLADQMILVTRAAGQSSQFTTLLQQQGAHVLEMPALEIQPPSSWQALDTAIAQLNQFDWLALTSANAVNYFFERLATLGHDSRRLAGLKIAVVGEKTAQSLQHHGIKPDFIPPDFVADALVEHFPESVLDKRFLFPRVETGGRDMLVNSLTEQGANVTEVAAYQSVCPATVSADALAALRSRRITIVSFASSKTVSCFSHLLGEQVQSLLQGVKIASIGPQTSQTCQMRFGRVDIEATDYTLEGLTQAIVQFFQA